jgi:O-antigen ligase
MTKLYQFACGLVFFASPLIPSNILLRLALIVGILGILPAMSKKKFLDIGKAESTFLLFAAWSSFSLLWSPIYPYYFTILTDLFGLFICFSLLAINTNNAINKNFYGWMYLFGCLVASILIINNWLSGITFDNSDRYSIGDYINPNYVAYCIAVASLVSTYFIFTLDKRLLRNIFLLTTLPLMIFSVLLTGSRGAIISIFLSLLALINIQKYTQRKNKIALNMLFLVFIGAILILIPFEYYSRFIFEAYDETGSGYSTGRLDMWTAALEYQENWLFGEGFNSFGIITGFLVNPHNILVSLVFETGLIGFLIFLVMFIFLLKKPSNTDSKSHLAGKLPLIIFIGWLPMAMTGAWGLSPVAWLIFSWGHFISKNKLQKKFIFNK